MSLVCSSRHSLYVWYSKRPQFTRRFSSSRFRIILPWMKKTLLLSLSRGTLTRTSWLTYLTVLARGDSSWNKWEAPVHDLWCCMTKKNWLQSKVCGIWTRQLSPLRGRYGQILKTTLREAAERRAQTICMVISMILYWMCSITLPTSLVFKPACQQRKAALYCMEVWRGLSTKFSFWLNKNSSANLPTSSNVFAFCSSMNGWTSLRHRFDWFYSNCMWRVSRNFAVLTIPNNTACQCMFLSWAL